MLQVSGYTIVGELGRGGMGVVYKARQLSLNRTVALKMILSPAGATAEQLARFRREAETVARLGHPGIVQVFDFGEENGHPYYAMEYLDGGTLKARIAVQHFTSREAAALVATLADAVRHMHEQRVIHRDLKPSNVLLGRNGTARISDFGLAKPLDQDEHLTASGVVMGSLPYMAPEQAAGRPGSVGPPADVYALGVILYELLAGRPPFLSQNLFELIDFIRTGIPVPPRRVRPSVPAALDALCLRCLEKEPDRRTLTAQTLADELRQFLGEPRAEREPPEKAPPEEAPVPRADRSQWWRQ